jgi:hypothetical protein
MWIAAPKIAVDGIFQTFLAPGSWLGVSMFPTHAACNGRQKINASENFFAN